MIHFLNGKWVTENGLSISALDISVLRGFGIFDFLRTYNLKPFMLEDHLDRFMNSAKILRVKQVYSKKQIAEIVRDGIRKNKVDVTIKIVQTGGVSSDGFTPNGKPTFFILFMKVTDYPREWYTKGIKLVTSQLMRQIPEAKSINYMASIVEVMKAQKKGAVDILHTDPKGNMYESTRSNFYIVKKGEIITPKQGILFGITRKAIIHIAHKLQIKVKEQGITIKDLFNAEEAFISNSSMEIVPVVKVNNLKIGEGKVGTVTMKLITEFRECVTS